MNNIIIRDVEVKDVLAIKHAIDEVWCFSDIIEGEELLNATIGLYLNQILYHATFGRVAVLNGKVVGVIFGIVNGEAAKYRKLLEDGTAHAITWLGASEQEQKGIYEYFSKQKEVYKQLSNNLLDHYDASLDFLVLTEAAQGLGIGKKLWASLKAYFEEKNAKTVYLYTDTECNFGFYEHQGFTRKREQEVDFDFEGHIFKVTNFLYDIQLD